MDRVRIYDLNGNPITFPAEDAAHASGDRGIMALAVRKDTAAALAGTDGDYIPVIVDASGRLHIAPAPANSGVDIGDVDILSIAAGDNNIGNVDLASAIPAGTNNIGDVDVLTINGVAPQFDDTDKQAVSLYIKGTAAGDAVVQAGSTANLTSAPMAVQDFLLHSTAWSPKKNWSNLGTPTDDGVQVQPVGMMIASDLSSIPLVPFTANWEQAALASAARTASVDSADLSNFNARGVVVVIDVTAIDATPSITVTLQGKSTLGSDYYTILASAAIVGTGQTVLRVYPGLLAVANLVVNDVLPRLWRVSVAAADADSITYSVAANYIL